MANILLIEDSVMVQQIVKTVLEGKGHRLWVSGKVGTSLSRIETARIDLILMDLNLPDARGEDAIRAIRQHLKLETPIIVLSGEIKIETVVALKPLGVSGFIAKADDFVERLNEEVNKALGLVSDISDDLPV
jgi:CheY-like chemotaxis protein